MLRPPRITSAEIHEALERGRRDAEALRLMLEDAHARGLQRMAEHPVVFTSSTVPATTRAEVP